eukprot:gene16217-11603_t
MALWLVRWRSPDRLQKARPGPSTPSCTAAPEAQPQRFATTVAFLAAKDAAPRILVTEPTLN